MYICTYRSVKLKVKSPNRFWNVWNYFTYAICNPISKTLNLNEFRIHVRLIIFVAKEPHYKRPKPTNRRCVKRVFIQKINLCTLHSNREWNCIRQSQNVYAAYLQMQFWFLVQTEQFTFKMRCDFLFFPPQDRLICIMSLEHFSFSLIVLRRLVFSSLKELKKARRFYETK